MKKKLLTLFLISVMALSAIPVSAETAEDSSVEFLTDSSEDIQAESSVNEELQTETAAEKETDPETKDAVSDSVDEVSDPADGENDLAAEEELVLADSENALSDWEEETDEEELLGAAVQNMYRLYNPNSGEHFYTAKVSERNYLNRIGWNYEGIGWVAPANNKKAPVYRLYNPHAGDHHYTVKKAERDYLIRIGWKNEGIGWYSDTAKRVPLYRAYNPNASVGTHNYTTSRDEQNYLCRNGWKNEGIGWYGVKAGTPVKTEYRRIKQSEYSIKTIENSTWGVHLEYPMLNNPKAFPKLAAALEEWHQNRESAANEFLSDIAVDSDFREYIEYKADVTIRRFDTRYLVMTYKVSYFNGKGVHESSFAYGKVYDVQTGKVLKPSDLYTNLDSVASVIESKLRAKYGSNAFIVSDVKGAIKSSLESDSNMYCMPDYDKIYVAISPYVVASYGQGYMECEISMSDYRYLLKEPDKWMEKPKK
ncbi:MAG: hypothetical protein Q4B22_01195 [Eubacteriales bacterium]|nr:hypothetical protein [Eubacteriales bacterium]